jgi:hypothetical protein
MLTLLARRPLLCVSYNQQVGGGSFNQGLIRERCFRIVGCAHVIKNVCS